MLKLHAERLADIGLSDPGAQAEANYEGPIADASVEVRNLSFRHAEGEPWILKYCSFRIEAGESVAIVGPSDCGKATLAKLILGLLEPAAGKILFGNVDIRKLGPEACREAIGAVMQEDQLFAGSIKTKGKTKGTE